MTGMTIEVRQMLIKSCVGQDEPSSGQAQPGEPAREDMEQLKEEILAECRAWLRERLNDMRER